VSPSISEHETRPDLTNTRRLSARNLPKQRAGDAGGRVVELRVVEQVKEICSEGEGQPLSHLGVLAEREVDIGLVRTAERIPAQGSVSTESRVGDGGTVAIQGVQRIALECVGIEIEITSPARAGGLVVLGT